MKRSHEDLNVLQEGLAQVKNVYAATASFHPPPDIRSYTGISPAGLLCMIIMTAQTVHRPLGVVRGLRTMAADAVFGIF